MAREKWWDSIPVQSFTSDGTSDGLVTVNSAIEYHVKQNVIVKGNALPDLLLTVKRVLTENTLVVGTSGTGINIFEDISLYTVSANASIEAPSQNRPSIDQKEFTRAVFAEEPATAWRTLQVDQLGNPINKDNRFPVDAEVTVDTLQLLDKAYDSGTETYPSSTQEIVTTLIGGLSGTPVQRVTLNYTDSTKNNLMNFQRENWNGSSWVVG